MGRINLENGKVEYLELPTQIERSSKGVKYCWGPTEEGKKYLGENKKKKPQLANLWLLKANDMISNSGHRVVGDDRSQYSGWGHVSAALPTAIGDKLYVPTMSGLVYVINWQIDKLDGNALLSISDLGKLGDSWTRSSITFSDGLLFGRTIKELICISGCDQKELN